MPNEHLVQRLAAIQQALMAQHAAGRGMPNAAAGDEREAFLREFLQKVFPAHRRFSTGAITDSVGTISGQVDIAVEYGTVPSFPMPTTHQRLLLAESVALTIEVKSNLVAQWDQVRATTARIKTIRRNLNPIIRIGNADPPVIIPCIAVGYTGYATVQGIEERLASTPEAERPDAALVIESGCFAGLGMTAFGPIGLYALCIAINSSLDAVAIAVPNLLSYAQDGAA